MKRWGSRVMEETDFKGIDLLETGEWQGKSIACLGEEELKCALEDALCLINELAGKRDYWRELALSYVKRPTTIFRRLFMR